jgi:hypothetical protein
LSVLIWFSHCETEGSLNFPLSNKPFHHVCIGENKFFLIIPEIIHSKFLV